MTNQIKSKDSFIIYRSFIDAIKSLPDTERLQIFDAISLYALDGKEANLSGISYAVFTLIKPQLDANRKRFENGCKDKKKSKTKAKGKQKVSKPEANDNDNLNLNPNDNDDFNPESEFELFWQSYKPIHVGKGNKEKSKQLFLKAIKKNSTEEINKGLVSYMNHCHSKNSYTKSVEVWLRNESWKDEYKTNDLDSASNFNINQSTIDSVNKIANHSLIHKITVSASNKAILYFSNSGDYENWRKNEELREQVKEKIITDLKVTGFELPKFIN